MKNPEKCKEGVTIVDLNNVVENNRKQEILNVRTNIS